MPDLQTWLLTFPQARSQHRSNQSSPFLPQCISGCLCSLAQHGMAQCGTAWYGTARGTAASLAAHSCWVGVQGWGFLTCNDSSRGLASCRGVSAVCEISILFCRKKRKEKAFSVFSAFLAVSQLPHTQPHLSPCVPCATATPNHCGQGRAEG